MESLQIIGSLVMLVAVASSAVAQSADWQVVKGIPEGTKIKVTLKHQRTFGHCELEEVTDEWLGCYFAALGSRQYARDEIREVRLGHHSARIGFAVGAGTGAILGAANGSGGSAGRVFGVVVLVPVLGGVGAGVGAIVDPFLHGKTVYRSPEPKAGYAAAKPQSSTPRKEPNSGVDSPVQR